MITANTGIEEKQAIKKRLAKKHSKVKQKNKELDQIYKMIAEKRTKIKIDVEEKHQNYYEDKMNVCDDTNELLKKYNCMQKSKEDNEEIIEGIHIIKGQTKSFPIVNITDYASKSGTMSLNGSF